MSADSIRFQGPRPVVWHWLLVPAALHVLAHLLTNGNYGLFRDEYYYLACADRLAWGYVDHPPLSILLLAGWKALFGDSLQAIRILPALAGGGLVVLTGVLTAELGGRPFAQLLSALAMGTGAVAMVLTGLYSMNAFDYLFWAGAFLLLARLVRTEEPRLWLPLGLLLGVGLQNKIGLLVFGISLVLALLSTRHRRWLVDRHLWIAGGLALAIFLPYVLWNLAHDWPTLEFIRNAKEFKISDLDPLTFLAENVLEAHPGNLPIWLGGLGWLLFAHRARSFRVLGVLFVFSFVVMIVQKAKPYYLSPAYSLLMAAGGCAWEGWTEGRHWRWVRIALPVLILGSFVVLSPLVLPVLPIDRFLVYQQKLGVVPETGEEIPADQAPQYFSDRFGWESQAAKVAEVWARLAPAERSGVVIVADNYGEAGALEYWARKYELPPVVSGHNNYWLWTRDTDPGDLVLAIGFHRETLEEAYEDVQAGAVAESPFARESRRTIWICRGRKLPSEEIWRHLRHFI